MIFDEDDARKKPQGPKPLVDMSIAELQDYVARLKEEIARVEAEIAKKEQHRSAIEGLFGKK